MREFCHGLCALFLPDGKRASVELIVRVIACLAEGLGIRGTAQVLASAGTQPSVCVEKARGFIHTMGYYRHNRQMVELEAMLHRGSCDD
jgi:hypothetical protein